MRITRSEKFYLYDSHLCWILQLKKASEKGAEQ